ncbi:MAG: type VI secretion system protein TssA [Candidatus Paracaedibacteraceae bacterium]|nr:type VI secretion system protein TssA [Candidatus Paracaedibacteraceae bacterium]
MSDSPNRSGFMDVDALIQPIAGDNPCGISLRYEPIYDQIRDARREDDDTISYGIWQHDLKRADWFKVESLCCDSLASKTKDLQIAGWLTEAWIQLDGIDGLCRGLDLIAKLTDRFWSGIHPTIRSGDLEYRSQFFDWMNKSFADRLVKLLFIPNELGEGVSYANWLAAQRLDTVKRTPNSERWVKKAEERGQISFKQCHTLLSRVTTEFGDNYLESIYSAQNTLHDLKGILDVHYPDNTLAFDELGNYLDDMARIYKAEMSGRERSQDMISDESLMLSVPPQPALPVEHADGQEAVSLERGISEGEKASVSVNNAPDRDQIYRQLGDIADTLDKLEPHSPAPQVIRKVISWKDKSLMDIFNEVGSSPEDLVALMRFLGVGGNRPAA